MHKSKFLNKYSEVISIILLVLTHRLCLKYCAGFVIKSGDEIRWIPFFISVLPVFFVYQTLRFVFTPLPSCMVAAGLLIVINIAHVVKLGITDTPLSWSDLFAVENVSVIKTYLSWNHYVLLIGFACAVILSYFLNPITLASIRKSFFVRFSVWLLLLITSLHPFFTRNQSLFSENLIKSTFKLGFGYVDWDWPQNVRANGLPLHLIQTGFKKRPKLATEKETHQFLKYEEKTHKNPLRPKRVVYVLCESCWHDKTSFKDLFSGFEERGYESFRVVSPVFGGGTVNASFELLTGLPSRTNALSGTIYQEYATDLKPNVSSLPQAMRRLGYQTIVMHNHERKMWKRDVVMPKFGFDKFVSIEEMQHQKSSEPFADDSILFNAALDQIKKSADSPLFLYLITVHGHGPYPEINNDGGEQNYRKKIAATLSSFLAFEKELKKLDPEVLILLVSDHKPGLNKLFYEKEILPREAFDTSSWWVSAHIAPEVRGDVPAYLSFPNKQKSKKISERANSTPLYCLSEIIDDELFGSGLPAFEYGKEKAICRNFKSKFYPQTNTAFPDWLYSLSLFQPTKKTDVTLRLHSLLDF